MARIEAELRRQLAEEKRLREVANDERKRSLTKVQEALMAELNAGVLGASA